jgi:hypothetical protein
VRGTAGDGVEARFHARCLAAERECMPIGVLYLPKR